MVSDFTGGGSRRGYISAGLIPILKLVFVLLIYTLSTSVAVAADSPVQTIWFYKPPESGGTLQTVAENFDRAILTRNDEDERETLKSLGMNSPYLQYVRADAIQAPCNGTCPCSVQPKRNQVAWDIGDFCDIKANHSDWFLRDIGGNLVSITEYGDGYIWMDPGNQGWRTYFLNRVSQFQAASGWDGVFLDNVDTSINRYNRAGIALQNYPDHVSWQNAVSEFLAYLYSNYFASANVPLSANIAEMGSEHGHVWMSYIENLDAGFHESFAVDWDTGYRSVERWEEDLDRVDQSVAKGKQVFLVSQGNKGALKRQKFALASYLLVSHPNVYFRYQKESFYKTIWLYDNYDVELGQPAGARKLVGGRWERQFSNGYVSVDPAAHTAEIVIDSTQPPVPGPPPTGANGPLLPWLWLLLD